MVAASEATTTIASRTFDRRGLGPIDSFGSATSGIVTELLSASNLAAIDAHGGGFNSF